MGYGVADYIIVGAGSAGCVLANRLSTDPNVSVVLIEAGGKDRSLFYRMPAGFFQLMKTGQGNWNFGTTPQKHLGNRKLYFPRGKVWGGSSSINGLVVARGTPADYDRWAQLGNRGWSYVDCLPWFRKVESFSAGDAALHGHDGPIGVTRTDLDAMHPIPRAFIDAGIAAGYPFNDDVNSGNPYGMAQMQGNFAHAARQSSSVGYLRPVLDRPNLRVISNALVHRVVMTGSRATGVALSRGRTEEVIEADKEVILCGGTVNSPQLLQLSGIGDPDDLLPHGIAVRQALPGVGRNLQDHLAIHLKQRITRPISVIGDLKPLASAKALLQYLLFKSGPVAAGGIEAWAHLNSRPDLDDPDIQFYCVPLMYNDHGRDVIQEEGFLLSMNGSHPRSVGTVRIASGDPRQHPLIDPNYFSDPEDARVLRQALRMARDIIAQAPFDPFRGSEFAPGADVTSDDALDSYIRQNANSIYHPVGTCKMGRDSMAVVDERLRVHGVEGLRVVDASVMPAVTSGNTNFPTMMIAEKAAAMIIVDGHGASPVAPA